MRLGDTPLRRNVATRALQPVQDEVSLERRGRRRREIGEHVLSSRVLSYVASVLTV